MEGFLAEVARDLYERTGGDPSGLSVLFPSRRARLFFVDALARIAERPMWQPRWLTVDDLNPEGHGNHVAVFHCNILRKGFQHCPQLIRGSGHLQIQLL